MASILNSLEEVENERGLSLWQIDEEGKNETGTDLHRLWLRPRNLRLFVVHGVFTCLEFSFGLKFEHKLGIFLCYSQLDFISFRFTRTPSTGR